MSDFNITNNNTKSGPKPVQEKINHKEEFIYFKKPEGTSDNIKNSFNRSTFSNGNNEDLKTQPDMKNEKEINKNNSFLGKIKNTIRSWLNGFNFILSKIGLTTAKSSIQNDIELNTIRIPKEVIDHAKYCELGFDKINNNDLKLLETFSDRNKEYNSYTENSIIKNTETGNKKHTFILGEKYPLSECVANDLQRDKREYSAFTKTLYNHGHSGFINLLNKDDYTVTNINPSKHFIDMIITLRKNLDLPKNHNIAHLDSNGNVKINPLVGERLKIAMCNN